MRCTRPTLIGLGACLLASLAGCGGGGGVPPSQASYFPLAEGNTWSYHIIVHVQQSVPASCRARAIAIPRLAPLQPEAPGTEGKGPRPVSTLRLLPAQSIDQTATVIGSEIIEGRRYWALQAERLPDGPSVIQHMRTDSTGVYAYRQANLHNADFRLLKLPPRVGDSWTAPDIEDIVFTTEATDDTVTVPTGTFRCVRVRQTDSSYDPPYSIVSWFAYAVGLIQDNTFEGDILTSELKLVSYELH